MTGIGVTANAKAKPGIEREWGAWRSGWRSCSASRRLQDTSAWGR
jgi:hypothetical protein